MGSPNTKRADDKGHTNNRQGFPSGSGQANAPFSTVRRNNICFTWLLSGGGLGLITGADASPSIPPWPRSMFREAANESDPRAHAVLKHRSLASANRPDSQLTPKDAILEVGPNALELQSLTPSRQGERLVRDRVQLEKRRAQKQERKRSRIRKREEMKFSHSIQFNAVPDWSSHYISYSNLKKLYGFRGILAGVSVEANPPKLPTD